MLKMPGQQSRESLQSCGSKAPWRAHKGTEATAETARSSTSGITIEPAFNASPCSSSGGARVMVDPVAWKLPGYKTQDADQFALAVWPKATGCSHGAARLIDRSQDSATNGLVLAAVLAFKHHHSLEITPDAIFNTIMAGVSAHVNADPERFRSSFVAHEGKKNLLVLDNSLRMGSWSNRWDRPVARLGMLVLQNLSNEAARKVLTTSFSTTGPREAAAHTMTFMDVVKGYFSYTMLTDCGIPWVDVLGCKEDWERLAAAIGPFLGQLGLESWNDQLQEILRHFVQAFGPEDQQDKKFWSGMFKYNGPMGSGTEAYATGWLTHLFPYIRGGVSPAVTVPGALAPKVHSYGWQNVPGVRLLDFPRNITETPFIWDYHGTEYPMQLLAGTLGVSISEAGSMKPEVGWVVAHVDSADT